jgi:AP2 domain
MRKLHPKPEGVTKYRGVSWDSRNGLWRCQLMVNGRRHYLGWHEDAKIAAMYYDKCKMEAAEVEGSLKRKAKTNAELELIPPLTPKMLELLELGLGGVGGVNPHPKNKETVHLI